MKWRDGKTYDVETTVFEGAQSLKYFGELHLPWHPADVHMFYSVEQSKMTDNLNYEEGDLIGLRDEDIISAEEGRGRSGGFPY